MESHPDAEWPTWAKPGLLFLLFLALVGALMLISQA
jgi:hypothetical protein